MPPKRLSLEVIVSGTVMRCLVSPESFKVDDDEGLFFNILTDSVAAAFLNCSCNNANSSSILFSFANNMSTTQSKFRPCIDLHDGKVKQIVGGTLENNESGLNLKTNFEAVEPPSYYSKLYADNHLSGGHVIKLGKNNDEAALEALSAYPNGLQLGGGVDLDNADYWLSHGATKVIVTSWLFPNARFEEDRLRRLAEKIGRDHLVVDLSCRRDGLGESWVVATNKWNTRTEFGLNEGKKIYLSLYSNHIVHTLKPMINIDQKIFISLENIAASS